MMKLKMTMNHGNHKFLILILIFFNFSLFGKSLEGNYVEIQILDKISAKVKTINFEVYDSFIFESLKIEVYSCLKSPPEEIPENYVLLKIYDYKNTDKSDLIYQGWMISSSPSTTPFEHPIYDLWLKDCKIDKDL